MYHIHYKSIQTLYDDNNICRQYSYSIKFIVHCDKVAVRQGCHMVENVSIPGVSQGFGQVVTT